MGATLALLVTACAQQHAPSATSLSSSTHATAVNPANIKRVARELPPGYEIANDIPADASPGMVWGLGTGPTATPPQCGTLADPGIGRDQSAQGVSGSGAGGIVDAVVVASRPGPVALDHDLVVACHQWTMTSGHTTATVTLTDAPHIDGIETLGMVADVRTSVESGAEIDSRTCAFIAYLGDYYAFTTLITDPGAAVPALIPQFAADLLVKTVATLRG